MIRYAHAKFAPLDFINKKIRGKRGKPNIPFIPDINNEHAQDYSCPGATFAFCSHRRKVTSARRVTWCCTTGNLPLEVALGQRQTHVNSYRRQTVHRGKVDPGVSELPRGNELSRDHVNRP